MNRTQNLRVSTFQKAKISYGGDNARCRLILKRAIFVRATSLKVDCFVLGYKQPWLGAWLPSSVRPGGSTSVAPPQPYFIGWSLPIEQPLVWPGVIERFKAASPRKTPSFLFSAYSYFFRRQLKGLCCAWRVCNIYGLDVECQ